MKAFAFIGLIGLRVYGFRSGYAFGFSGGFGIRSLGCRICQVIMGGFQFDSNMLPDKIAKERGEPRLLGVDNPIVVPVNKNVEIITTGGDVIHSWAVPAFGVKMDAIPGRLNHTWFKATKLGTYYGQCSELCGANHAFMPIEVKVVTEAEYRAWLLQAKRKYASSGQLRLASND